MHPPRGCTLADACTKGGDITLNWPIKHDLRRSAGFLNMAAAVFLEMDARSTGICDKIMMRNEAGKGADEDEFRELKNDEENT